ncbi:MAG: type VII secretion protein EccE [Pseudonocardiales bacterium]
MTTEHKAPAGRPENAPVQRAVASGRVAGAAPTELAPGRGRLLGVGVIQLVACELAAVAVLLHRSVLVLVLGPLAVVVVILALGRRNGRWLYEDWGVRRDFRRRAFDRSVVQSYAAQLGNSRLAALHELHPQLHITEVADRSGETIGVVSDGRCYSAMLALEPARVTPGQSSEGTSLSLDIVAEALRTRDVALAGIQVLTHTVPAPTANLPESSPCVRSYAGLSGAAVPARRTTWIISRLDPAASPAAVDARGGGEMGSQRALLGTMSRLTASLRFAGIDVRPVGGHEALDVLSLTAGATSRAVAPGAPRTTEHWTSCTIDETVQACFWVRSWPTAVRPGERGLLVRLGDVRGRFNVVSLTMTSEDTRGVHLRAVVRVAGGSPEELAYLAGELQQVAQGARLVRLDGQQVPGVIESMPLGGSAS